jgi:branched-chain amino acid transport system permease protein
VNALLLLEQGLNGLQFGLMLFLLAAGLTLVFGIMDLVNLAHGSLYMVGAYLAATLAQATGSFWIALPLAMALTAALGMALEVVLLRRLYERDHLSQVLATFALILIANDLVQMIWGPQALMLDAPRALAGTIEVVPGAPYPAFRAFIIVIGLAVAAFLYWLIVRTRAGALVRAGASNREMALALGVDVKKLFTLVFGLGAALCALAGAMLGPLLAVQIGMGENILILAFVVVVIGGIGSIRGALVGALLVGMVDTIGRAFLPAALRSFLPNNIADALGPTAAAIAIYVLMAAVLYWKPTGLFPARG